MAIVLKLGATPNRVSILCRYLLAFAEQGVTRNELQDLLAPRSLRTRNSEESAAFSDVLTESRALGLVEEEDGTVRPSTRLRDAGSGGVLAAIEAVLLHPARAEEAGQGSFPYALAWLLTRDSARPLPFGQGVAAEVNADCGEDANAYGLTNTARFQAFCYWACYLGFAWRYAVADSEDLIVPDPAAALRRYLPAVFDGQRRLHIRELVAGLADLCPVLEGGSVRSAVEERLPPERRRASDSFSPATIQALNCLEADGTIALEQDSDADKMLAGRPVSHVALRR